MKWANASQINPVTYKISLRAAELAVFRTNDEAIFLQPNEKSTKVMDMLICIMAHNENIVKISGNTIKIMKVSVHHLSCISKGMLSN